MRPTTLPADMSESFTGRARILDPNGFLVDVGLAELHRLDPDSASTWGGKVRLFVNAALASKTMESILELENGQRARALVGPRVGDVVDGELVEVRVIALQNEVPF